MKISEMAEQFEVCEKAGAGCMFNDCPLSGHFTIETDSDFDGSITWKVEACLLFGKIKDFLEDKKPGT